MVYGMTRKKAIAELRRFEVDHSSLSGSELNVRPRGFRVKLGKVESFANEDMAKFCDALKYLLEHLPPEPRRRAQPKRRRR